MNHYLYACLATFVVAFHLFSLKLLSLHKEYFYEILGFTIITMLLSRYFIFLAMRETSNPTDVHLILNCSIFITLLLSYYILKNKIDLFRYVLGILFVFIGLCIVHYA